MALTAVMSKNSVFNAQAFSEILSDFWVTSIREWEDEENRFVRIVTADPNVERLLILALNDFGKIKAG